MILEDASTVKKVSLHIFQFISQWFLTDVFLILFIFFLLHSSEECCYVVAVVKSEANFNINDLKGKTSCHSCRRLCFCRSGGWKIPIGRLVAQNKIPWDGPDDMPLEKG